MNTKSLFLSIKSTTNHNRVHCSRFDHPRHPTAPSMRCLRAACFARAITRFAVTCRGAVWSLVVCHVTLLQPAVLSSVARDAGVRCARGCQRCPLRKVRKDSSRSRISARQRATGPGARTLSSDVRASQIHISTLTYTLGRCRRGHLSLQGVRRSRRSRGCAKRCTGRSRSSPTGRLRR